MLQLDDLTVTIGLTTIANALQEVLQWNLAPVASWGDRAEN